MDKTNLVGLVQYDQKNKSVEEVIRLSCAFEGIKPGHKVFIKPNIVIWSDKVSFPKWGVITTTKVISDTVAVLKDMGVNDITIGEGIITIDPKNKTAAAHAFKSLGYEKLRDRYGIKFINIFERPAQKVEIVPEVSLRINADILETDFIVNLPVLKTHAQTVVSLGMKNLKGVLLMASRKKCHSANPQTPLDFMVAHLPRLMPPQATIIDGIYSLEKGPSPDGKARRSNILAASSDLLSVDMVGAKLLGHDPKNVPYLVEAARLAGRPLDLSDIVIKGAELDQLSAFHEYDFPYNENQTLHIKMEKMGIKGLSYKKYDQTLCTYCSIVNGAVLTSIVFAWKGTPWDDVEVLTGKIMQPGGHNKTILLGKCMCQLHKNNPAINEMITVKGCPPDPEETIQAFHKAGIMIDPGILRNIEMGLGLFMRRYENRPEFNESFFQID